MKKVLFIAHEIGLNGASKSLLNLVEVFQDKYDIYVLIKGEGPLADRLREFKCTVLIKPFFLDAEPYENEWPKRVLRWLRYRFVRKPKNNALAKEIAMYVREHEIEIIHTNSSSTFMGAYICQYVNAYHIWHFREFLYEDFRMKPVEGWEKLYYWANNRTDQIIAVSNAVRNKYTSKITCKIQTIYNGVPAVDKHYSPNSHEGFNLLQSGIISPVKGVDVSIRALYKLYEMGYKDIHLYLAGKGELNFCANEYEKVKDNVHLLGYVDDLPKFRQTMIDAELICSRAEAFGRVTIEAMQAGLPVIGASSGGTVELIKPYENGILFSVGDADDLAEKILILYKSPDIRTQLSRNAMDFASQFTIEKCAKQISTLYSQETPR